MSRINDLIKELCPNGVEYVKLEELVDYIQPAKYIVKNTNYDVKYDVPVLTAGQTFILGYTNEKDGIYYASADNPVIIFDDFTTSNHWVDFNFKVKSSAMKILISKTDNLFKYIYYCISNIDYIPKEHSRQWIQVYSQFQIPLPPLKVQKEIARILDKFGELEADLEAELEARKSQYEFWRGKLLNEEYETKHLSELSTNLDNKRRPVTKSDRKSGEYPYYGASGIVDYVSDYIFDDELLLVSEDGANLMARSTPIAFSSSGKVWINNHAHVLKFNSMITQKYVEHYLNMIDLSEYITGAAQPKLNQENLNKIRINIPSSIEGQEKIVIALKRFDRLINDISVGLPAEIELRKQQYKYYRNKLLSFENFHELK